MSTALDILYADTKSLLGYLEANNQISFRNDVDNSFKKIVLLSSASYFESEITTILINYATTHSFGNTRLSTLLYKKGIEQQYFKLFDFKNKQEKGFFSLFGDDCRKEYEAELKKDIDLKKSASAFLEIGHWRNYLVHQNYAEFDLPKTAEEVYELHTSSLYFLNYLRELFKPPIPAQ